MIQLKVGTILALPLPKGRTRYQRICTLRNAAKENAGKAWRTKLEAYRRDPRNPEVWLCPQEEDTKAIPAKAGSLIEVLDFDGERFPIKLVAPKWHEEYTAELL